MNTPTIAWVCLASSLLGAGCRDDAGEAGRSSEDGDGGVSSDSSAPGPNGSDAGRGAEPEPSPRPRDGDADDASGDDDDRPHPSRTDDGGATGPIDASAPAGVAEAGLDAGTDSGPLADAAVDAGFSFEPKPDAGGPLLELRSPRLLSVGATHACAIDRVGTVFCWGNNALGQLGDGSIANSAEPVEAIGDAVEIGVGAAHSCALLADATVHCWGDNSWGQLGPAAEEGGPPREVKGLPPVVSVSVGGYHACVILEDGSVRCWGRNEDGQLGNESTISTSSAVEVVVVDDVVQLAAAEASNCALGAAGQVHCWGNDDEGQLGWNRNDDATTAPIELVGEYSGVVSISLGPNNGCAALDVGVVACWGTNRYGQLGAYVEPTPMALPPVRVAELGEVVDVSTGEFHSCALLTDGRVSCWGDGFFGSLGSAVPPAMPYSSAPREVAELEGVVQLSSGGVVGGNTTCALVGEGEERSVVCWGRGSSGQLGDGNFADRAEPVSVLGL